MLVAMYVDPYSYDGGDRDREYEEIEKFLTEALPEKKLAFRRNLRPYGQAFTQSGVGIYVFDIGGLCYVSHDGRLPTDFSKNVLTAAQDLPDTVFLPWSLFSRSYIGHAVYELWIDNVPDDVDDDVDESCYTTKLPPNVWCPPKSRTLTLSQRDCEHEMADWLRRMLGLSAR